MWTSKIVKETEVNLEELEDNQSVAKYDDSHYILYTEVGKKAAGRELDGVVHSDVPGV